MKRRWFIRGFFIGLLLLCVGAWGWSYIYDEGIAYDTPSRGISAEVSGGKLYVYSHRWLVGVPAISQWTHIHLDRPSNEQSYNQENGARFLGFDFDVSNETLAGFFHLPLWFPTALSTGLLWIAWRKTRPKAMGRLFPVEAEQGSVEKAP